MMRVLVVGAGAIAKQHIGCLLSIACIDQVAVCDLSAAAAEATAQRYGLTAWSTDFKSLLSSQKPDVVHVTTPVASHFELASQALEAGAHVIVEKPIVAKASDLQRLLDLAHDRGRHLIEDYNYIYNDEVVALDEMLAAGKLGRLVHAEVCLSLDLTSAGGPFRDPHAALTYSGMGVGPAADFLPHLASLCHHYIGKHLEQKSLWRRVGWPHVSAPTELLSLVRGERGTARLLFSATVQPDSFAVNLYGTQGTAGARIFEPRLVIESVSAGPKPLQALVNGVREQRSIGRGYISGLSRKIRAGPGAYAGMWRLIKEFYQCLLSQSAPPVSLPQISQVNRLVCEICEEVT